MKKYPTSLAIGEMQIKMTLGFHFTLVKMAAIKKTNGLLMRVWTEEPFIDS